MEATQSTPIYFRRNRQPSVWALPASRRHLLHRAVNWLIGFSDDSLRSFRHLLSSSLPWSRRPQSAMRPFKAKW